MRVANTATILVALLASIVVGTSPTEAKDPCDAGDRKVVDEVRPLLVVRIENEGRDVYVNRAWYEIPLQTKQATAEAFLQCISAGSFVNIYDAYTGKHLAKHGSGWGYRNYED